MMNDSTLRLEHVAKSFGGVVALDDFCFEFPPQGAIAIIGPNGAGKTTLFNVLTGFVNADAGVVLYGSDILTGKSPWEIARTGIGRTFQGLRIVRDISVLDNVMLGFQDQRGEGVWEAMIRIGVASDQEVRRREAMTYLSQVGLAEHAGRLAGNLSYGQQKLLTLACCMAGHFRVMLLDEPFAGVHVDISNRIARLFEDMVREERLIVFTEHYIPAVRMVSETVLVMNEGRLVAKGATNVVLSQPEILKVYVG